MIKKVGPKRWFIVLKKEIYWLYSTFFRQTMPNATNIQPCTDTIALSHSQEIYQELVPQEIGL